MRKGDIILENKPGRVMRIKASGGCGVLVMVGVSEGRLVRVGEGPSVGVSVMVGSNVMVLVCNAVNVGRGGVAVGEVKNGNNVEAAGDEEEISVGCTLAVAVCSVSTIATGVAASAVVCDETTVPVQFAPMKMNEMSKTNRGKCFVLRMLS